MNQNRYIDIATEVAAERMKASEIAEILIQGLVDRWILTHNGEPTFYANEVKADRAADANL
jgi:hypothetical protein